MKIDLVQYFKSGFELANRSLEFALITILISLAGLIPALFSKTALEILFIFFNILIVFFAFGYGFSLPYFLSEKEKNKKTDLNSVFDISFANTKRIIVPGVILAVILFTVSFIIIFAGMSLLHINTTNIASLLETQTNTSISISLFFLAVMFLSSFMVFNPIYFSIEKKGLFASIKASIIYAKNHLDFTVAVFIITSIIYILLAFLPSSNIFVKILTVFASSYEGLFISASSLLYFQKNK